MERKKTGITIGIWTLIAGAGVLLGLITDGFTVWDRFNSSSAQIEQPIVDFRCEPLKINAENAYDQDVYTLKYQLQTSNGTYQIIDSIRIDTLIILEPDFFFDIQHLGSDLELQEILLDKRILNAKNPEQKGILKLHTNFVLEGEAVADLYATGEQITIAQFRISIPYKFNNRKYRVTATIPIILYDPGKETLE